MEDDIFKISVNIMRAQSLKEMALERLEDITIEKKPYKIIEEYYEIIKKTMATTP